MNFLAKRNLLHLLNFLYLTFIFLQIAFGRAFSGFGTGLFRVTTIVHVIGFCFFIFVSINGIKNKTLANNKVVAIQVLCFLYLFLYYIIYFGKITNFSNLVETLRHTSIYFVGIWYILGKYISRYLRSKTYLIVILSASIFQFFSYSLYEVFNMDFLINYSDKGLQIYNGSDLGGYFFLVVLPIIFIPEYADKINFSLILYFLFLPAIINASRGSFVAYVVAGIYLFFFVRKKLILNKFIIFLIILCVTLSLISLPRTIEDEYSDSTLSSIVLNPFSKQDRNNFIDLANPDSNISYRLDVWSNMLNHTASNSPKTFLLGEYYTKTHPAQVEINNIYITNDPLIPEYPHNFIIFLLSKFGLFGLSLFSFLLFNIYKDIELSKRRILFSGVIFLLVDGLFDYVLSDPYTPLLIFTNLGIIARKFKSI
jgi:hypothetical protein